MDEIPDDIIRDAGVIGEEIAEEVVRSAQDRDQPVDLEITSLETIEQVTRRIDALDPELDAAETVGGPFPDLSILFSHYVGRFQSLISRQDGEMPERLPLLRIGQDPLLREVQVHLDDVVSIDFANERSTKAIVARARSVQDDPAAAPDLDMATKGDPRVWDALAETVPFLEMRPVPEAARNFFSLFTVSYWMGRRSVAKTGQSTVHFTVDCSQHGYQLEYWPQFLFTPTVFGGKLTRPVSATIPINHYHFQGWLNNAITPDGGLYPADANNTHAMLRAF